MRFDQMRETVTFKKLSDTARNIGIKGEAGHWAAMAYEVAIETPDGIGIHHEMGHFLMNVQANGTTQDELFAPVIRQATIPRPSPDQGNGRASRAGTQGALIFHDAAEHDEASLGLDLRLQ